MGESVYPVNFLSCIDGYSKPVVTLYCMRDVCVTVTVLYLMIVFVKYMC